MTHLFTVIAIFLGGGAGASLRHGMNMLAARWLGHGGFPYATLTINILGSLLIGMLVVLFEQRFAAVPMIWRSALVTGVLGGFTTFSAFSLETLLLVERGDWGAAFAYVATSVLLSLGACAAGLWLARAI